jgi:hypothetical protein
MNNSTTLHPQVRPRRAAAIAVVAAWGFVSAFQIIAALLEENAAASGGPVKITLRTVLANAPFALYRILQFISFLSIDIDRLHLVAVVRRLPLASVVGLFPGVLSPRSIPSFWSFALGQLASADLYSLLLWTFDYMACRLFRRDLAPRLG